MDVAIGEDNSQVRTYNAAENLARMWRLALNVLKRDERIDGGVRT